MTGGPEVGRLRAWVLASRPKTLPAAVAPVVVGAGLARGDGVFALLPALAALLAAVAIQIGTNIANDYHDWQAGADAGERLGPVRVTQAGLLPPDAVRRGIGVSFGAAVALGAYLVYVGGWPIAVVGVASIASGIAYTAGPFPLGYHGLGDLFVFVFFGPVAVGGTYWVQARALPADALIAGAGVGCLITAILVVNNLRDIESDARAGKRTLAVRLGEGGSKAEYVLLVAAGAFAPAAGIVALGWEPWTLLSLASLPFFASPLRAVLALEDPRELNPALARTARGAVVYSGLLALGFLV